ncbi:MAG: tRNA (adenosine(37)-N6)-dimethylallyltransferase MiaA [Phycisphaeraceae bacterium]|nr:tRNA (adenosine(37)-N6)-dimethylallyltransferase MiaA [Phycisphaeraceae bacterium]MCW5754189.1 tRNA (adenosine(37)-N6)-dimethylallyltransferase MiaA [Phycisphaeraceae bacterium]
MQRFPVIIGPTAGGKTALAVEVAHQFAARACGMGEVVSADSMLLFRGLDIGSAKPTASERRGVPHHLIDVLEPTERFSVHQWLAAAEQVIDAIQTRGHVPVVVGGTHLYVKALLEGLFEGPGADDAVRQELLAMEPIARRSLLERVDPAAASRIHPNDERRTVRALEVWRLTGKPISTLQQQWDRGTRSDCVLVGLEWPVDAINQRINARVRAMVEQGLVDEAKALWASGRLGPLAAEGLGYKQLVEHFEGRCSLEEAVEAIKIETRRFAKNQRTWLKRLRMTPGSIWVQMPSTSTVEAAQVVVDACLR